MRSYDLVWGHFHIPINTFTVPICELHRVYFLFVDTLVMISSHFQLLWLGDRNKDLLGAYELILRAERHTETVGIGSGRAIG